MKLIDKDALVAELKERIKNYWSDTENAMGIYPYALEEVIKYVNTLEVKDVDLEKEATRFVQTKEFAECEGSPVLCVAKHFFELGLRQSK